MHVAFDSLGIRGHGPRDWGKDSGHKFIIDKLPSEDGMK